MERDRNVETAIRMPGKEEERQKFRKTRAKSSRYKIPEEGSLITITTHNYIKNFGFQTVRT